MVPNPSGSQVNHQSIAISPNLNGTYKCYYGDGIKPEALGYTGRWKIISVSETNPNLANNSSPYHKTALGQMFCGSDQAYSDLSGR